MQERATELLEYVKSGIARGKDPTKMIQLELERAFIDGKREGIQEARKLIKEMTVHNQDALNKELSK